MSNVDLCANFRLLQAQTIYFITSEHYIYIKFDRKVIRNPEVRATLNYRTPNFPFTFIISAKIIVYIFVKLSLKENVQKMCVWPINQEVETTGASRSTTGNAQT